MNLTKDIQTLFGTESEITNLRDLFLHGLQDLYFAEKTLHKALSDMEDAADTAGLKRAFKNHREETRHQAGRLEQIFEMIGHKAEGLECKAIEGLIAEGDDIIEDAEGAARDAGLIYAGQAVEHYEIARYTSLIRWAEALGFTEAIPLLKQSLQEEKAADALLTRLAEEGINDAALMGLDASALRRGAGSGKRAHGAAGSHH
ncbi:MAG: ferritin-like domain-containing protein [Pseudomonadaceae bacterium]|nr:ferritin-like domain-containing protein [Pseudomonadaceae bacterium]